MQLLCTYRLNWSRRTSWGWWDEWDDTVLQTQDSEFEPWRSEAEHATSRSRRLPTILTFTRGWERNIFVSFKPPRPGTEPRALAWKAAVLTTTLGPPPILCEYICKDAMSFFEHHEVYNVSPLSCTGVLCLWLLDLSENNAHSLEAIIADAIFSTFYCLLNDHCDLQSSITKFMANVV